MSDQGGGPERAALAEEAWTGATGGWSEYPMSSTVVHEGLRFRL